MVLSRLPADRRPRGPRWHAGPERFGLTTGTVVTRKSKEIPDTRSSVVRDVLQPLQRSNAPYLNHETSRGQ
jgi:hypothetical protein